MGLPFDPGALQDTVAEALPRVAVTPVGLPGAVGAVFTFTVSNVVVFMVSLLWDVTANPASSVPAIVTATLAPGTAVQVSPSADV